MCGVVGESEDMPAPHSKFKSQKGRKMRTAHAKSPRLKSPREGAARENLSVAGPCHRARKALPRDVKKQGDQMLPNAEDRRRVIRQSNGIGGARTIHARQPFGHGQSRLVARIRTPLKVT